MIEAFEELFDFDDDGELDNLEKKSRGIIYRSHFGGRQDSG